MLTNSLQKCKQIADKCKQTADKSKQTAETRLINVNKQLIFIIKCKSKELILKMQVNKQLTSLVKM